MIHVSAAIIQNESGEILICQRGLGGDCAFLWEFPGGKQETGETAEECLIRECREELDVDIGLKGIFEETIFSYPTRNIAFTFFHATILKGELKADVHNDVKWVKTSQLTEYAFCPADQAIIEKLTNIPLQ